MLMMTGQRVADLEHRVWCLAVSNENFCTGRQLCCIVFVGLEVRSMKVRLARKLTHVTCEGAEILRTV